MFKNVDQVFKNSRKNVQIAKNIIPNVQIIKKIDQMSKYSKNIRQNVHKYSTKYPIIIDQMSKPTKCPFFSASVSPDDQLLSGEPSCGGGGAGPQQPLSQRELEDRYMGLRIREADTLAELKVTYSNL
jgi:hypothetical protein